MPVSILLSYSDAPQDQEAAAVLVRHLTPMQRSGAIAIWHRGMALPSEDPDALWTLHVNRAPIILLLVSADLEIDRDSDIAEALRQRTRRNARVIPVLWRPVNLKDLRYQDLKMVPDGKAVSDRKDKDQAWVEVVEGIRRVVQAAPARQPQPVSPPPAPTPPLTMIGPADGAGPKAAPAGRIKILFIGSNPADTTRLRLGEERRDIGDRIQRSKFRDRFELADAWAVTRDELGRTLLDHMPTILHFSGHGGTTGEILLEDAADRQAPVAPEALARLFQLFAREGLRGVVLNACYSATQAPAIAQHLDFVIGISDKIKDASARTFATNFYTGLAQGKSVEFSFEFALAQLDVSGLADADLPKLFARPNVKLI